MKEEHKGGSEGRKPFILSLSLSAGSPQSANLLIVCQ
jgi:hypothetical protein